MAKHAATRLSVFCRSSPELHGATTLSLSPIAMQEKFICDLLLQLANCNAFLVGVLNHWKHESVATALQQWVVKRDDRWIWLKAEHRDLRALLTPYWHTKGGNWVIICGCLSEQERELMQGASNASNATEVCSWVTSNIRYARYIVTIYDDNICDLMSCELKPDAIEPQLKEVVVVNNIEME